MKDVLSFGQEMMSLCLAFCNDIMKLDLLKVPLINYKVIFNEEQIFQPWITKVKE